MPSQQVKRERQPWNRAKRLQAFPEAERRAAWKQCARDGWMLGGYFAVFAFPTIFGLLGAIGLRLLYLTTGPPQPQGTAIGSSVNLFYAASGLTVLLISTIATAQLTRWVVCWAIASRAYDYIYAYRYDRRNEQCLRCGYDLRGTPHDAVYCPECGASIEPHIPSPSGRGLG
ncbi:MAG: hypothetical protein AAGB29_06125 [Planctomycetota bacterium]